MHSVHAGPQSRSGLAAGAAAGAAPCTGAAAGGAVSGHVASGQSRWGGGGALVARTGHALGGAVDGGCLLDHGQASWQGRHHEQDACARWKLQPGLV